MSAKLLVSIPNANGSSSVKRYPLTRKVREYSLLGRKNHIPQIYFLAMQGPHYYSEGLAIDNVCLPVILHIYAGLHFLK